MHKATGQYCGIAHELKLPVVKSQSLENAQPYFVYSACQHSVLFVRVLLIDDLVANSRISL